MRPCTRPPLASPNAERLRRRGLEIELTTLSDSARTAPLAAAALNVEVGQIVKSLVFERDRSAGARAVGG